MKNHFTKEDWQRTKKETAIFMIVPALVVAFSVITNSWGILATLLVVLLLVQCGLYVYASYQERTHD
jgi:Ca2+/Na+ antiporter